MTTLSTAARNAACNATVDLVDVGSGSHGSVSIRDADNAVEFVVIDLPEPAFGSAVTGVATAQGTPFSGVAAESGDMARYVVLDEDGNEVWRGTIGTTGADMIVDAVEIAVGQTLVINSWTHTVPA